MAFTFTSTPSGTSSNSYLSVSQADDYFAGHLEGETWWGIQTTPQKQQALVMATVRLEAEMWGGSKTLATQRLQWPREWISTRDGDPAPDGSYYRDANTIPDELMYATCELALHYLKKVAGEFLLSDDELQTASSYSVGPLTVDIKGNKGDWLPDKVKQLLQAIGPNAWVPSKKMGFVR